MTIVINKKNSKNIKNLLVSRLDKASIGGNLSKHYGKLKRNLDGLNYQLEIRKDED